MQEDKRPIKTLNNLRLWQMKVSIADCPFGLACLGAQKDIANHPVEINTSKGLKLVSMKNLVPFNCAKVLKKV